MIKIKFFTDPLSQLEPWLNRIASKGYRLVSVMRFVYKFEETNEKYSYATQFIGAKSWGEIKDYIQMLEEDKSRAFFAPLNQGNISFGKIRLRPYAKGSGKLATGFTNYNREILIVENAGEKEALLTDKLDIAHQYKDIRNAYLQGMILLVLLLAYTIYKFVKDGAGTIDYVLLVVLIVASVWITVLTSFAHGNYKKYKE